MRANSCKPDAGAMASEQEYRLWIARFDALWAMPSSPERHRQEMQQLLERIETYETLAAPTTNLAMPSASLPSLPLQTGDTQ
ncbi:hypothetical protein [Oxalicibacterium solurbis]|uniref:hypothetical protein n=1 Tax=Oxalicibacterium solurbis TaxID=69280 RepID=UPI001669ECDB|nr:hypothetical protein [Oxalicibacterium solurbis]